MRSLILFLLITGVSSGDTGVKADSMPTYLLGEIFVVAKKVSRWIVPPAKIDMKTVQKEGARTVADAVKLLPGVDITVGFKNEASLMVQGFTSKRIAVLMDGRPVNNPYYGSSDLLSITTDDVFRIDVLQGNTAPVVAVNGMGGVVNIVTMEPKDSAYTRLLTDYGSGNSFDLKFNHGKPFNLPNMAQVYYAVNLYRGVSDGYPLPDKFKSIGFDDGGLRDNSDYVRNKIQLKFGYRIRSRLHLGISAGIYRSSKGVPPAEKMDASYWRFPYWNRDFLDLSGEFQPDITTTIKMKLYADRFVNDLVSYKTRDYDPNDIWWDSLHDLRDRGMVLESSYRPSQNLKFRLGVQYRVDFMNRRPDVDEEWLRDTIGTASIAFSAERHTGKFSLSSSVAVPFFRKNSSSWQHIINPGIGFSWKPISHVRTWVYAARSSRFPTGHELFSTRSGNPNLKPESANRFQSGFSINFGDRLKFSILGFYNDIRGMIDRPSRDSTYRNIAHALTAGSEMSITIKRGNYFQFTLSYTNTIGKNLSTGEILPGIANHKLVMTAEYHPSKYQLLRTSIYYRSRRFWPHITLKPCMVVNLYTEQVIWGPLKGFISIKNLFDTLYEEEPFYPMPGRTVTMGVMAEL